VGMRGEVRVGVWRLEVGRRGAVVVGEVEGGRGVVEAP
jgi:hypothetical protein